MRSHRVLVVGEDLLDALALVANACEQLVQPSIRDFRDPWDRDFGFPWAWGMDLFRPEGDWDTDNGRVQKTIDQCLVRPVYNWRAAHYVCDRMRLGGMNKSSYAPLLERASVNDGAITNSHHSDYVAGVPRNSQGYSSGLM